MEAAERDKQLHVRQEKHDIAEAKLIQTQTVEMNALKKKLEGNLNVRHKNRDAEYKKMMQHYRNYNADIANKQVL